MPYEMNQPDPLSPFIFSLVFKTLACLIKPVGGIWKIQVAEFKHNLLPYADHILGLLYRYIRPSKDLYVSL